MSTPPETLDLCKIISESRRIMKSQVHDFRALSIKFKFHHFRALSVLFLLPCSWSVIVYPTIQTIIFESQPDSTFPTQILINLLYIFFVPILFACAVATISYSTFHGFYGKPVEVITSIKSISHSFFPLVSTLIVKELTLALISSPFVYQALQIYGSESFYNSNSYYIAFTILMTLVCLPVLIYLRVNWILVSAVVVVESKWGFEPMRRSAQLVKGKRGVAFFLVLHFVLKVGAYFWVFNAYALGTSWGWDVLITGVSLGCLMLDLLFSLVANVVLYVYCIEMHGELLPNSSLEEFLLLK